MEKKSQVSDLAAEARRYADLRVDELKLKATDGLSKALGQVMAVFLIIAVLGIFLGLLAYALLQWLNAAIGAPWGTLIVCAVFAVALVVLVMMRKKLFRDTFVKLFIDLFYEEGK